MIMIIFISVYCSISLLIGSLSHVAQVLPASIRLLLMNGGARRGRRAARARVVS